MRQKVIGFVKDVAKQNLKKNKKFFVFSIVIIVKKIYIYVIQKLNQNIIYYTLYKKNFFFLNFNGHKSTYN